VRACLRPDGFAPLIGDTDSGQVLPIVRRRGDDHRYLLALGAAVFQEPVFKTAERCSEEVLWILGESGVRDFEALPCGETPKSEAFRDAGIYVLRENDLYSLFNASDSGLRGRGAHGHNDALSVEISACGTAFIVDPGSYVYTADLHERHLFRSTAYHSTVQVDGSEQNVINEEAPFLIGNEARPHVLKWESGPSTDVVVAEHQGYERLGEAVMHQRTVTFFKADRCWLIEDEFSGTGKHHLATRFHFDTGLEVEPYGESAGAMARAENGTRLLIQSLDLSQPPHIDREFVSRDYGAKEPSLTARWSLEADIPCRYRWLITPICSRDDERERLKMAKRFDGR
jgi:Heparinase II/III-like protein